MKRLKLKPSARDKRRYFLVKAKNSDIEKAILEYVGTLGFAKSCYMSVDVSREKKWSLEKDMMIGSCVVGSLDEIRAALGMKKIEIIRVSGTLKALREKAGLQGKA